MSALTANLLAVPRREALAGSGGGGATLSAS